MTHGLFRSHGRFVATLSTTLGIAWLVAVAGCNLDKSNPNAPTQDAIFGSRQGIVSLAIGVQARYGAGLSSFIFPGGLISDELGTPSGQALGALVGYGMLGYFVVLLVPSRRAAGLVVAATLALVLAICFGRLYLGTRYFSDIVSGLAAGGVWLSACITGLEVARRRAERDARGGAGRRAPAGPAVRG